MGRLKSDLNYGRGGGIKPTLKLKSHLKKEKGPGWEAGQGGVKFVESLKHVQLWHSSNVSEFSHLTAAVK